MAANTGGALSSAMTRTGFPTASTSSMTSGVGSAARPAAMVRATAARPGFRKAWGFPPTRSAWWVGPTAAPALSRSGGICTSLSFRPLRAESAGSARATARIRLHWRAMSLAKRLRPLTKAEGRQIWLHAQRLDTSVPFGEGPQATGAAVEHLGYVQIDTINVIERSHHHILWNRIPAYRRADLRQAQSVDRTVFEYWTHALSYVPTRDLRFFIPAMKRHQREGHKWLASVSPADVRKVLRLIRRDGALTIRDIDDDVLVDKEHLWASRKPSKRALQLLFYQGRLTISERNGILKTYHLMTRHFGWDRPPKPASLAETTAYLLDRALRAQGLVSVDSICHLDAPSKAAIRKLIQARVRRNELVPVGLEGAGKQEHWAEPAALEAGGDASELVHILSPFDPLIIQRN